MKSIELQLFDIFKRGGLQEDAAKEAAALLDEAVSHDTLGKTFVRKDSNVATKEDVALLQSDLKESMEQLRGEIRVIASQIKTLQWLFAAVGIPILIAIFMQLFSQ